MKKVWDVYLDATKNKGPHSLLKEALLYVKGTKALDVGAGAFRDTNYLIENGFTVTAIDANEGILKYAPEKAEVRIISFDTYEFPIHTFDLINAQYALPFNQPETFIKMFSELKNSLKNGGVFAGQFFGSEDGWAGNPHMTFHIENEVRELLKPLHILSFKEQKEYGKTAVGDEKFWHVFHIIASKN
ncbi:MAG: class I SAM-dependent methyltransferase [Minisyncoccia bacterium]